jgi:thiosulfate/3-mercaptopyruvate sulfurtransferase
MRFKSYVTFLAVVVLITLGASPYAWSKNKFQKEVDKETAAVKLVREVQKGDYDLVTTEELKAWMDAGKEMLVIDTMPYEASYQKNHVPGAKQFLFPIPEMDTWDTKETAGKSQADYAALLGADKDRPIVVYCGFVKCTRSHNGAAWAKKMGYTHVYRYSGGIFAWKGAGYEVAKVK